MGNRPMIWLRQLGSISDIGLDIRWDTEMLRQQVNRRANLLSKMKIGRGSLVTILHGGSAYFFADLLATWTVGAAAACIDAKLTDAELKIVTSFAKPAAHLVGDAVPAVDPSVPILDLNTARDTDSIIRPDAHLDDPALVLFTSGTTGDPKGVVITFRALLARISSNVAVIGRATLGRALVTLPTHFGHGLIGNALTPLVNGGQIVLHPLGLSLSSNLGRIIDDYQISFMSSVPAMWHVATTRGPPLTGSSLARVHVGSAPLSTQLWSEIAAWTRAEVVNCYGLTETANWIAGASSIVDGIADGLVGRSWGSTIAIKADGGDIRFAGDGEIVVRSPGLMSGYLNRPDLTAAAMRDGWFHTGDRGAVDENGKIYLTGRIKDEINRAGMKIQPAEIDRLLECHPAIAEACTFAIADPICGERVAVLVRLAKEVSVENIQAWCRERMRLATIPERWIVVDEMPRNARGKVNRDALRRAFGEAMPSVISSRGIERVVDVPAGSVSPDLDPYVEPVCRAESRIIRSVRDAVESAWTEVLGRGAFSANLSWNDAGGDSLGALRLWLRIENILGKRLDMAAMDLSATASKLIAAIERQLGESQGKLISAPEEMPCVFYLPPLEGDTPQNARFRAAFAGRIRFVAIRYPSWRDMIDVGGGFDAIVNSAEAQIRSQCHGRVCFLAGYSFGGFVAWEAARRLIDSGWRMGFVGLIDTRRDESLSIERVGRRFDGWLTAKIGRFVKTVLQRPSEAHAIALQRVLALLVRAKALWMLHMMGEFADKLQSKAAFNFQLRLASELRRGSLRKWEPSSLPIPITLFRSDDFEAARPDFGWGSKCSQVAIMPVGGSHASILTRSDVLGPSFLNAIDEAFRKAAL